MSIESISDIIHPDRVSTSILMANIEAVRGSRNINRHCGQEVDFSGSSPQRILTKDLDLDAYKVQLGREPMPTGHVI